MGLSFAYYSSFGEALCPTCMLKNYDLQITDCPLELYHPKEKNHAPNLPLIG